MARALGEPPDMRVLVLEFSGGVDTEAFNAVDHTPVLRAQSMLFAESVSLIAEGLATGDVERIGWACERARRRLVGLTAVHAHRVIGGGVREFSESA